MNLSKLAKKSSLMLALAVFLSTMAFASDIFSVKTALDVKSKKLSCSMSVVSGDVLEFDIEDLEKRLGLSPQSLGGITVTSLPQSDQGELVINGVTASPFDFYSRDEVNELCFVPYESAISANITFVPKVKDAITTELSINVIAKPNLPPLAHSKICETVKNVTVSGRIDATDPENDSMSLKLMNQPSSGSITFDGLGFRYTPYKNVTGKDSFTVCAVDSASNYSNEATVSVTIERARSGFYYTDMQVHPSAYAAIKLHDNKIITGTQIGKQYYFYPDKMTERGDFLVMLMSASCLDKKIKPTVNTGLPNDSEIPAWLKPYVKTAIDEDIWSNTQAFYANQIPTRAEAVVLVDRTAKINDVKTFNLTLGDHSQIPDWAMPSYRDLAAYRMLDLHDNMAYPESALTNSYSADLVWQLWKYYNE